MSIQSVVEFWRSVQTDPELQAKLAELDTEGDAELAREKGFDVTPQEMRDVEAVVSFWERVEGDAALRDKLAPANESETPEQAVQEIAKVAKAAGFELQIEALTYVTGALVGSGAAESDSLSDDQLDAVAGGASRTARPASLRRARRQQWKDLAKRGPGAVGAKP